MLFDEDKLPLPVLSHDDAPLEEYSVPEFSSIQIWLIRKFWIYFLVEGHNFAEIEDNDWNEWFFKLNDFVPEYLTDKRLFYSLALVCCRYLEWLDNYIKGQKTNAELALLSVYKNEIIKRDQGKLYQHYLKFSRKEKRTNPEDTALKNKNKIELFEKVIKELSADQRIQAEKDLKELKYNLRNELFTI